MYTVEEKIELTNEQSRTKAKSAFSLTTPSVGKFIFNMLWVPQSPSKCNLEVIEIHIWLMVSFN